jgi:hypothetical protein
MKRLAGLFLLPLLLSAQFFPAVETATATPTSTEKGFIVRGSINLTHAAGTAILTGNGVTGAGSVRVTIASDNTAFTVNVGTFPDNEPINVAQMNGVAVTMNNGVAGTGVQRNVLASDNSAIANWGLGATGAAPPSGAQQIGGVGSGATGGFMLAPTVCTEYANIVQTAGAQIITGVSGRRIYICSLNLVTATAQNIAVVAGTGTTCATTTVAVPGTSGGATAATGWNLAANSGIVIGGGGSAIAKTTVNADNLCILQSGAGQVSGAIAYAIY